MVKRIRHSNRDCSENGKLEKFALISKKPREKINRYFKV